MSVLAFCPNRNTAGKSDYRTVFRPLADELVRRHGGKVVEIDIDRPRLKKRARIIDCLERAPLELSKFDAIAFCCHGIPSGIPQMGFDRRSIDELASGIALLSPKIRVMLYACSTGASSQKGPADGDNSFADLLRDALCAYGALNSSVMGHTKAGHALKSPFIRLFLGLGSPVGGHGGFYVVAPKSALWGKWKRALAETDLGYRFPFMPFADIHTELTS